MQTMPTTATQHADSGAICPKCGYGLTNGEKQAAESGNLKIASEPVHKFCFDIHQQFDLMTVCSEGVICI
jgi:hypothetical protein